MLRLTHSTDLRKKKGFTLIELIVVIVIIGILAAIAIVGYNAVIKNSRKKALESSAQQVAKIYQSESAATQTAVTGTSTLSAEANGDITTAVGSNTFNKTAGTLVNPSVGGYTCTITFAAAAGGVNTVACA